MPDPSMPEQNGEHPKKWMIPVFMLSALVLQFMLFFLHFMIYETLVAAFGVSDFISALVFFLLSLTFISASLFSVWANNAAVVAYYRFSAIWFSFVAPLSAACAAFVIIENLFPIWGWVIVPFTAGMICFGAAVALSLYGIWNASHLRATRISIPLPGLPDAWRGKRMVFFSDVHFGNVRGKGFAKRIVKKVQAQDPFVVAIAGDFFDGTKCDAEGFLAPFKELRPPQGIYFASGNHEYIRNHEIFFNAIRNAGITILNDEKINILGVDLVGADWEGTNKREKFTTVLEHMHLTKERPSILLRHVPDNLDVAERAGVSLQLSGHTHQGQFWPLSIITHYFYKGFDYGLHYLGKMAVYTSSGVGTWMSPFRFGTKAEIVVIEFE